MQIRSVPVFFGPYALVLSHMAINHNMHFGFRCREELKTHIANRTLQGCYENYLRRDEISDIVVESPVIQKVIFDFYFVLKLISKRLSVCVRRQLHHYGGKGFATPEQLARSYGRGISRDAIVFQPKTTAKPIAIDKLNRDFKIVIEAFYGASRLSHFINQVSFEFVILNL